MSEETQIPIPAGFVVLTTYGSVCMETVKAWGDTRQWCVQNGLTNIGWQIVPGTLVDKVRNDSVEMMLAEPKAQWLLFLDADMIWEPDVIGRLLQTAYKECTWAAIVGAWCPQKGEPFLPTIDLGSGTWEPIAPNDGNKEVMRTGSACVLIKREVFERIERPWYSVHPAPRAIDMIAGVDNWCNQIFDGENPFRKEMSDRWNQMEDAARQSANQVKGSRAIGEDSGLCDAAKALGYRIVVNTNAVLSHVHRKIITAQDHINEMENHRKQRLAQLGILE